ncbi:hypothetical protein [Vibrio barjaei]|uniref:hypothetical protein n=1 Tax=Vibrio barjaei TaxID=1676683 RepID=UPI002283AFEB|nr:hypothetical protein [Vibrio barjaei]MCY9870436.1 hypothetical protein [Vibrio barjaei]
MKDIETLHNHIGFIQENILNEQVEKGQKLSNRFFNICTEFRGFDDPSFDLNENTNLLNDLLNFEREVGSLDFLYVFYGYIGRMHLQTGNPEKAVAYAQASLELCKKERDTDGIKAARNLLCDIAIANDAALIGVKYFKEANPELTEEAAYFSKLPNHNSAKVQKWFDRKTRPSTYKFFSSQKDKQQEEAIRLLMIAQGYSRATASKYLIKK